MLWSSVEVLLLVLLLTRALLGGVFAAPALAADAPPALVQTDAVTTTLPNGLVLIVESQPRTDLVALHLKYGVGSRDQAAGQGGCAHLFEHLMFEGSGHVPQNAFDEWLTAAGGDNNAWTSTDETAYHMTFPSGALDLGLFLESDRMGFLGGGLTAENLKNQQDVVLRERAQGYADPHGRDWDAMVSALYPEGHPYHSPVIGTEDDIRAFSLDSTRSFWEAHYRPRNGVLAIVGNVEPAGARQAAERWFSDIPDKGPASVRAATPELPPRRVDTYLEDAVEDWTVYLTWPGPERFSADEAALETLMAVLSGGRGTRLDDTLYYKGGLATEVWAAFYGGDIGGPIIISAVAPKPKLTKLTKKIEAEIAGIIAHPPTEAELQRARVALSSQLQDQLEEPAGRANWLADCQAAFGHPDCMAELWTRYQKVTSADVVAVAQRWLVADRRVSLSVIPQGRGGALPGAAPVEIK